MSHVLDTLTALQHDAAGAAPVLAAAGDVGVRVGVAGGGTAAKSEPPSPSPVAPPPVPAAPVYDVLAIVSAMESLAIDTAAVIDAIGGMTSSSLDALRTAGVPYSKCVKVKQALANDATTTDLGAAVTVCYCF